jgi:hypothetical protein
LRLPLLRGRIKVGKEERIDVEKRKKNQRYERAILYFGSRGPRLRKVVLEAVGSLP